MRPALVSHNHHPTPPYLQQWLLEEQTDDVNMVVSDGLVKGSHAVGVGGVDVEEGRAEEGRHDILVPTTAGVTQGCVSVLTGEM